MTFSQPATALAVALRLRLFGCAFASGGCRPVTAGRFAAGIAGPFPFVEFAEARFAGSAHPAAPGPRQRAAALVSACSASSSRYHAASATSALTGSAAHPIEAALAAGAGPRERPPVGRVLERRHVFQIGDDLRRQERADPIAGFEARAVSVEAIAGLRPQSFALAPHRPEQSSMRKSGSVLTLSLRGGVGGL